MNSKADLLRELRIDRSPGPPPSRRWIWIAVAIVIALVLLLAISALSGRGAPVEVQVAPVVSSSSAAPASVLDASGYVVARRMATVSAKITGRVREVLIEEGMEVEEGQVMATLDPVDADAQRNLSAAQLAAARTQVANVQAQLTEAEASAQRLASLVDQQLVSRAQYDQAVAQRDSLRAQLASTQRQVDVASDQLHIADLGVDNTIVRAPFAGVVIA
ncbi:MAG TPA: biotin/lipoyl-binding protein, partial [Candidatus Luteimonas excrementigallinarum]|nr:biotin/lipoyl-binding protein [Candidatus Luteimonas excrementigallinarum]